MMFIKKYWNKIVIVLVSILFIVGSLFVTFDNNGKNITNESLEEAIIVFGVAKGLNAAISLAQGTEISPPGLTLTIGEVLDPINDLVEQFSWIMLASITSLGLQKILFNIVTGYEYNVILSVFIVLINVWLFVRFKEDTKVRNIFFKVTVIMIFLRFSIPMMSIADNYIYENYVKNDYNIERTKESITQSSDEINKITYNTIEEKESNLEQEQKKDSSVVESIKEGISSALDSVSSVTSKIFSTEYYTNKINEYKVATEKTSEAIIDLIIAFVFKTIFFPIVFLFFLYQLLRSVFNLGK